MAKILFWGGLGDEIAITGVAREMALRWPTERVTVEGVRYPELFLHNPHIDRPGTTDGGKVFRLPAAPNNAIGNLVHAYAQFVGLPAVSSGESDLFFTLEELRHAHAEILGAPGQPVVAIDTWAFWPSRRWAFERFAAVATHLQARGYRVIELGNSYPDVAGIRRTQRLDLPASQCLLDRLTIRETAAVLAHCQGFVGNDSGLAHLAAAVRTPAVPVMALTPWYARAGRFTFPAFSLQADCGACHHACVRPPHESCLGSLQASDVIATFEAIPETFRRHGEPFVVLPPEAR